MINQFIAEEATIAPDVKLGVNVVINGRCTIEDGVVIGNNCTIDGDITIKKNTVIEHNVVVQGTTTIGADNHIYSFCCLGAPAQHKRLSSQKGQVTIGNNNVIREYVTVHQSIAEAGTSIGNDNYIMAYCHIAHDCFLGSDIVMTNGCNLAGHVEVDSYVTMGLGVQIHQYCRIGCYTMLKMGESVIKDVIPFSVLADGKVKTINLKGLKRRGVKSADILIVRDLFRTMTVERKAQISSKHHFCQLVGDFLLQDSHRGVYYPVDRKRSSL